MKSSKELYVTADLFEGSRVFANRKLPKDWEKFQLMFVGNDSVKMKTSTGQIIRVDSVNGNRLVADTAGQSVSENFIFRQVDGHEYLLLSGNGKYVSLGNRNELFADKSNSKDAEVFTIGKVKKNKFSYFSFSQLLPMVSGLVLLFISLIFFQTREDKKWSILLLLAGGFLLRIFVILLDPFLNLWDEQFHALVAKNMLSNPFKPMLYTEHVLPYEPNSWIFGHIWLHKQPVFLWQMALSMLLFGVNTFAVRLPSALMSTIAIYFIYRIGKITINKEAGYYGALLFSVSFIVLKLVSGIMPTEHNDIAFLFFVTGSVWSWVEYTAAQGRRRKLFLIAIGVFSGCAVLVKWLTGLLVFSGWGLAVLFTRENRKKLESYMHLLIAFAIAAVIIIPWQIYILNAFPAESRYEYQSMSSHFSEVIEGHGGNFMFHLNMTGYLYGISFGLLILSVLVFSFSIKKNLYRIALTAYILIIYIFFSLAATKMIAFTFCISGLVFLTFGNIIDRFFNILILNKEYLNKKSYRIAYHTIVLLILCAFTLDVEKIQADHTLWKKDESSYIFTRTRNTTIIKNVAQRFPELKDHVVFNVQDDDRISMMFFSNVKTAYSSIPDQATFQSLKERKIKMAFFDNAKLPDYIANDKTVLKIDEGYWQ